MESKMMRISGRGPDGFPKAVKVDMLGRPEVVNSTNREVFERLSLDSETESESDVLNNEGSTSARTVITSSNPVSLKVTKKDYRYNGSEYVQIGEDVIHESDQGEHVHVLEYALTTEHYTLTVENTGTIGTNLTAVEYIGSSINVGVQKVDVIDNSKKRAFFSERQSGFNAGTTVETAIYSTGNDDYAMANIVLLNDRLIRVYIQNYYYHESADEYRGDGYKPIYESDERAYQHAIDYYLTGEYYSLMFENIDTIGASISEKSTEKRIRLNTPVNKVNSNDKIEDYLERILDKIGGGSKETVSTVNTKSPQGFLEFYKSEITARVVSKGNDGRFYIFDGDYKLKKYDDIVNPEGEEIGIEWDIEQDGTPANIQAFESSIVIFTNTGTQARIYQLDDINDTPTMVYESSTEDISRWPLRSAFGIKSYDNGLTGYVLAGVYGNGGEDRDLLLSTDSGRSFTPIKTTKNISGRNAHWHDVAFDVYGGLLWASQGDGEENRGLYFSEDMGESWQEVGPLEENQPTAILPFADKVVFGRDSKVAGLDVYKRPMNRAEFSENQINTLKEFKSQSAAYEYYGHSPILDGDEGYLTFSLYPDEKPIMVMGTGDGGGSWHSLFMDIDKDVIKSLSMIDDKYIYAYGNPNEQTILYAKRIDWR